MLIEPALSERSISTFASKVMRRLSGAGDNGRSFGLDDIKQELRIAWIKASQTYNAEIGVPFQAYLVNGMKQHVNRLLEKHINRRHDEVISISLDQPIDKGDGDGKTSIHSFIASDDDAPGLEYENHEHFEYVSEKLSPRAKLFLTLLYRQPAELLEQVVCLRKKTDFGKHHLGITLPTTDRLATWMVFDLMDAPHSERGRIVSEIRALGERLCEVMNK